MASATSGSENTKDVSPDRSFWREVIVAVVLTILLAGAKLGLEKWTDWAPSAEQHLYEWLQFKLKATDRKNEIVVVDFEKFPMTNGHTSRKALTALMNQLVQSNPESNPLAVGLDVDFSPLNKSEFYAEEDGEFLHYCLDWRSILKRGLFVGINSSLKFGPEYWLGAPQYKDLAAYVGRVNPGEYGPDPKMDESVKIPQAGTEMVEVPSLGAALAQVFRERHNLETPTEPPSLLEWAVRRTEEPKPDFASILYKQFWVDFSPIDDFRKNAIHVQWDKDHNTITTDNGGSIAKRKVAGKIVLLGRGLLDRDEEQVDSSESEASDRFPVPGHAEQYAGVLLQACATYTLLDNRLGLLYLTEAGRIALDAMFSLLVFVIVAGIQWHYIRSSEKVNLRRLNRLFTFLAVVTVFSIGEWMLNVTRLMWDDYLLVMMVLIVHSWLENHEEWVTDAGDWTKQQWRRIVLQTPLQK